MDVKAMMKEANASVVTLAGRKGFKTFHLRQIAAEAECDPRSVAKVISGGTLKTPAVQERITEAIRDLGYGSWL